MKAMKTIILTIILVTTRGLTFMMLWNWFITPLGTSNINIAHSIGLLLLIEFVKPRDEYEEDIEDVTVKMVLESILVLVIGAVIHTVL